MARGNQAKAWVTQKIIETFGQSNVIEYDKKLYITTTEDGAPIQVALTLTCPKNMVGVEATAVPTATTSSFGGLDWTYTCLHSCCSSAYGGRRDAKSRATDHSAGRGTLRKSDGNGLSRD